MDDLITRTAVAAGAWWADRLSQQYAEKRAAFIGAVARRVEVSLHDSGEAYLENDYDPKGPLLDALHEVGIECRGMMFSGDGIFPRKHELSIKPGKLEPKDGYGNWTDHILIT